MGQKINITSLRSEKFKFNNLHISTSENIYLFSFLKILKFFFWQKKLFLTNAFFFSVENKLFLTFFLFFRVVKLTFFFGKKYKKKKNIYFSFKNLPILFKSLKFLKKNLIIFKFFNLNIFLTKRKAAVKYFFFNLKKQALILFPRRYNFFLDFIQLTILFIENKITITFFIQIFVEIFRILQKKRHAKFFIFIIHYFNLILLNNKFVKSNTLLGIKLMVSGKLKGKPRSSHFNKVVGAVPIQTISCNISFAQAHAYTVYGVFGIKLWISRYI